MRWLLTLVLPVAAAWPAVAQENEAEKLFRIMEQKVRTAKTLQLRCQLSITDAASKNWNINGTLTLGEGDKLRLEVDGRLFGEAVKFLSVSDGIKMKSVGDPNAPKEDKTEKSPKGIGACFRGALPHAGLFASSLNMDQRNDLAPERFKLSAFKFAGKEKIGAHDTQVIEFTVREKGAPEPLSMKIWLDAKTNLPVKLAMSGGKSDITDIIETYSEFTVDAKVGPRLFELPK